eukprot:CAMPEP_0118638536 /NCGR_PEP_ID=MMETSP0785-20121206/3741_1 /TAXON_ID=91992 /ORGANISM="Bolidomonas pacifica, Strain CCMP 1866" /LENGTH=305 /DNA_ID=CAMNT_0006529801 /DNA_START=301 /DNA_END=1218 /DNA_ORIENTATION=-
MTSFVLFLLPLNIVALLYANSFTDGVEMEASETRLLLKLPCDPSASECFVKNLSFDTDDAKVFGFPSPRRLKTDVRVSHFKQTTTLEPHDYDWWELHLNQGGRIRCEPDSVTGIYALLFSSKAKLSDWMNDGDSSSWFGPWHSKIWVKGNTGAGSSLTTTISSDGEIYVAIDNVYNRRDSTGSIACTIFNRDYDLADPTWSPSGPANDKIPSYLYAIANSDVKGEARVRWEAEVNYNVVGRRWLAPIWGLWFVLLSGIFFKNRSAISSDEKTEYARVSILEEGAGEFDETEPVIASVVSPSAPPK